MMNQKNASLFATLTILTTVFVVGCGGAKNKNPLEEYDNLKDDDIPYKTEVIEQKRASCDLTVNTAPTLVVTEGQTVTSDVELRGAAAATAVNLSLVSSPEGLTAKRINGAKYKLMYTARPGVLTYNQSFLKFDAELLPISNDNTVIVCPTQIGIVVTRTSEFPVIKRIAAPKEIELTSTKQQIIEIDVQAKNLKSMENLVLFKGFDSSAHSKENPVFNVAQALTEPISVTPYKNNTYRFKLLIDLTIAQHLLEKEAKYSTDKNFEMLAQIVAYNKEAKLESPAENIVIKFKRAEVKK